MLRGIRSRIKSHRTPLDRLSHLADTWRDSFDRLVGGTGRGHGTMGRVRRRVIAAVVAAGVTTVGAVGAYATVMASVLSEQGAATSVPRYLNLQDRATAIERLRAYRSPIDPSITPLRAGYAMQSITDAGGYVPRPLEAPTKNPIAEIATPPVSQSPFGGSWLEGKAMRQAAKGLTAEQRTYLQKLAAQPGAAEFSVLAHAREIDWIQASLVQPFPKGTTIWAIPVRRFSRIKSESYAQVARAVLALADRRPQEAERLLRENIGAGFALTEDPFLIDDLVGIVIVRIGRSELEALYEVTGRAAEARAISAELDPAQNSMVREADLSTMDPSLRETFVQKIIRDPGHLRGIRWEMATVYMANQPCGDLREVLFGPDAAYAANMREARQALVRTPGESQLMSLAENTLDTPTPPGARFAPVSVGYRITMKFAKAVDLLSGSRRMQSCASINPFR
jgi:hypothetical protein